MSIIIIEKEREVINMFNDTLELRHYVGKSFEEATASLNEYEKSHIDEYGDFIVYVPSREDCEFTLEFEEGECVRAFEEDDVLAFW
jgi:hypothetical protein